MATLAQIDARILEAEERRHSLAMSLLSYTAAQRSVANRQIAEVHEYLKELRRERAQVASAEDGSASTGLFITDNSDHNETVNGRFS